MKPNTIKDITDFIFLDLGIVFDPLFSSKNSIFPSKSSILFLLKNIAFYFLSSLIFQVLELDFLKNRFSLFLMSQLRLAPLLSTRTP